MTFEIKVDPYNGMTAEQFGIIAKEHYKTTLHPYRTYECALPELMYYFGLWGDTLRQCHSSAEPCFDSFMARVAIGDI